jgi:hypothetical protein
MKNRVQAVVGKSAREIDLQFDGKGGVNVKLVVGRQTNISRCIDDILKTPEFAGFEQTTFNFNIE